MNQPMLQVDQLVVAYGSIRAVHGVSFQVFENEIVVMLGPNGAGKSTILKAVSGLLKPAAGKIRFEQGDIAGVKPQQIVNRGISQVAEGKRLFFEQTVWDNLILGAYSRWRKNRDQVMEDLETMFVRFPILRSKTNHLAGSLSGGEQQMLVIAQALMARPRLLMLDEPSLGLAPLIVSDIFKVIQELHRDGVTTLLVEQRARQAIEVCNRGYILDTGRVIEAGSGQELRESPKLKQAYLG